MCAAARRLGGSYRRYSDDLLIVLPEEAKPANAIGMVEGELARLGGTTRLNAEKTEVVRFSRDASGRLRAERELQYLGFTFDGTRCLVRSSTLSKYSRQLVYAARRARAAAGEAGTPVFKRNIYRRFTHLGTANFVSRYCRDARRTFGSDAIRRQMRHHMRRVTTLLEPK